MVRTGLFFLLLSGLAFAGTDTRECPFCDRRMAASEAPDPWTRAFACSSCRGVVHVFSDGTESGHVYRNGRREIYVIDPHALTRPDHFVVRPEYVPQGVMSIVVQKNVLRCREIMQAEVRLPEQDFQREWGFAYDQPQGDYTAIATRCPKFKLIQGGKK